MPRLIYFLIVFFTMAPASISTLCQNTVATLRERAIETVM
jgi:hypothetical protein